LIYINSSLIETICVDEELNSSIVIDNN